MTTLARFVWRELLRAKGRLALIALILTIQAAALGGGYITQDSLYHTRTAWSDKLHLADLDVHFVPASVTEMPTMEALRKVPGVAAVYRRFVSMGHVEQANGGDLPVVVMYLEPSAHPPVNDIELLSGRYLTPGKPDVALVDRSFAAAHSLSIGDEIVVNPRRLSSHFTVGGTALSAEFLVPTANPDLLVPQKGSVGVVYASRESLDRSFPEQLYNDVAITFQDGADPQATTDAVLAALNGLEVERVVTKKATFGYRFLDVLLSGSRSVTPILAAIVALMAAIVALISVRRLVTERRREIGCLLAQGYSSGQLAACFFAIGLVPGVLGALFGVPAAVLFAGKVTRTMAAITGFPEPMMIAPLKWLVLAGGSALLVGLLSAVVPTISVLRMHPVTALRGGREIAFGGLPRLLERFLDSRSTSVRYAFRNVFRRVRLSVATMTLIALAVALPAGLLTSLASWDTWAEREGAVVKWDALVSFKVPLTDANVGEIMAGPAGEHVAEWEGYVQSHALVRAKDGIAEEMRVRGLPVGSEFVKQSSLPVAGRWFSSEQAAEAIVNTSFMGERAARLGDEITLVRKGVSYRFLVVGLVNNAALGSLTVPRAIAQKMFGLEGKSTGAYVRYGTPPARPAVAAAPAALAPRDTTNAEVLEKIDIDEATAQALPVPAPPVKATARDTKGALLDEELVTAVQVRSEFVGATLSYLASFNVIIVPFIGLSSILAFFFLVSVLGFLLVEREAEYATLRSLGYVRSEIATIVLVEVGVLAVAGLVLSLGAWAVTAYVLREPMAATWFRIPLDFRLHDFAVASLPTIFFLFTAALPGIRALMRMDLSSALRGRALG